LPDNAAADIRDADVRQYTVIRVVDEIVVDLMAAACGVTYEEAMRQDVGFLKRLLENGRLRRGLATDSIA
jgi:hypothetical protein